MSMLKDWRMRRRLKKVLKNVDNEITNILRLKHEKMENYSQIAFRYATLTKWHDILIDTIYDVKREDVWHG